MNAFHRACEIRDMDTIKTMIAQGNIDCECCYNPFNCALSINNDQFQAETIRFLIKHSGINIYTQENHFQKTLFFYIVRHGCAESVKVFLEHGVDRYKRDVYGTTARDGILPHSRVTHTKLIDTYFPITVQMSQVLIGLHESNDTPLTRLKRSATFDPNVLTLVNSFVTGKPNKAFDQLQKDMEKNS